MTGHRGAIRSHNQPHPRRRRHHHHHHYHHHHHHHHHHLFAFMCIKNFKNIQQVVR